VLASDPQMPMQTPMPSANESVRAAPPRLGARGATLGALGWPVPVVNVVALPESPSFPTGSNV
jgi:hypothetical protein